MQDQVAKEMAKDRMTAKLRCGDEQHVHSITHGTMLAWPAVLGVLGRLAGSPFTSLAFPRTQQHQPGTAGASGVLLSHQLIQLLCN
jgi:hypothetical protein